LKKFRKELAREEGVVEFGNVNGDLRERRESIKDQSFLGW